MATLPVTDELAQTPEPMDEDDLEDDLTNQMDWVHDDNDDNDDMFANNAADVMLKLCNLCGELDARVADNAANLFCRIAVGEVPYETSDAVAFRDLLREVVRRAKSSLEPGANGPPETDVSMALLDALRSTCFALSATEVNREYTRARRAVASQSNYNLGLLIVRNGAASKEDKESYSTADALHENLVSGARLLEALVAENDAKILHFIGTGSERFAAALTCACVPALFDGQRLRAGNSIAAWLFGDASHQWGDDWVADLVLNASGSNISLARVKFSFSAFVAMAQTGLENEFLFKHADLRHDEALKELSKTPEWKASEQLLSLVSEAMHKNDQEATQTDTGDETGGAPDHKREADRPATPDSITTFFRVLSDWFDKAVFDTVQSSVIRAAFYACVFQVNAAKVPDWVAEAWQEYKKSANVSSLCLWGAAEFLCSLRAAKHGTGMSVFVSALCVLSGAMGMIVDPNICGPFTLDLETTLRTAIVYRNLPPTLYSVEKAREDTVNRSGNSCGRNDVVKDILRSGKVRAQHEKYGLPETRLAACLTNLAMREALQRDIKHLGVLSAPGEGCKDLRRLYIIFAQTLPSSKHSWCFSSETRVSFLIEHSAATSNNGRTTAKNVPNPYRDTQGASVLSTLFFPLASTAFIETVNYCFANVDRKWASNECVDKFLYFLEQMTNDTFNEQTRLIPDEREAVEGKDFARLVFAEHRGIVRSYCKAVRGSGFVWEKLQISLSRHSKDSREKSRAPANSAPEVVQTPDSPSFSFSFNED